MPRPSRKILCTYCLNEYPKKELKWGIVRNFEVENSGVHIVPVCHKCASIKESKFIGWYEV